MQHGHPFQLAGVRLKCQNLHATRAVTRFCVSKAKIKKKKNMKIYRFQSSLANMLSQFRLFWKLFCPSKAFAKNNVNTSKKYTWWSPCWLSFAPFWVICVSFLWGMLHLGYACLISSLCWTILDYVSAMLGSWWTVSVYLVVLLAFVGYKLGPYWPYPKPLWAMWQHDPNMVPTWPKMSQHIPKRPKINPMWSQLLPYKDQRKPQNNPKIAQRSPRFCQCCPNIPKVHGIGKNKQK